MREYLKAVVDDERREFAAGLLEPEGASIADACREVFTTLDDPLLSVSDVAELLVAESREAEIASVLAQLLEDGFLEDDDATQRPFDKEPVRLYRLRSSESRSRLRLSAIESQGFDGDSRYLFGIEGRLIRSIARIDRLDALAGSGQQRQEIEAHVKRIAEGVRSGTHIPNPILLVMLKVATVFQGNEDPDDAGEPESFVRVTPLEEFTETVDETGGLIQKQRLVELSFAFRRAAFDDEKSVLLVDGQQRTAALSLVSVTEMPHIDVGVSAVVATDEAAKRVFQVANETVKISTDFSRALLASMDGAPGYLREERVKAEACRILALQSETSPFFDIVRYPGARATRPLVAYNSLFHLVGAFAAGLPEDASADPAQLADAVGRSFEIVARTWPEAWGTRPSDSRLMHGAGLRAMAAVCVSKLQGALQSGGSLEDDATWASLEDSLSRLATVAVWTNAVAIDGSKTVQSNYREQIASRQNTSQDIATLTSWLLKESLSLDMKANRSRRVTGA